jgi:four helix bundle protein
MERSPLDFERLDVYRCAIDFLALAARITSHVPSEHSDLRDRLRRASSLIPLNIAKACGKTGSAEQGHFNVIARGCAFECAAILDELRRFDAVCIEDAGQAETLLSGVAGMLSEMCR